MIDFLSKHKTRALVLLGLLVFVIFWSWLLTIKPPRELVEFLGVNQGYMVMFLVAVFGGVSTFTAASYIATLATLAAGGLDPILLGLIAGTGLTISDSFFFYLGVQGRRVVTGKLEKTILRFEKWIREKPNWLAPVVTYVYTGLTPLPNDVLTITLAFAEIKYRRIIIALWLGNMTLTALTAYLAVAGFNLYFI